MKILEKINKITCPVINLLFIYELGKELIKDIRAHLKKDNTASPEEARTEEA